MMNYDDLYELVKTRRSYRRFKSDPIPKRIVEKVLDIAKMVPSAGNAQPWEFIVVEDADMKKKISKNLALIFSKVGKQDPALYPSCAVQPHMFAAPVLIVVCGDPRLKATYPTFLNSDLLFYQSLAICEYGIQLAAACFDLATAWATIQGGPPEAEVKKLLGIPDHYVVDHIIPLGYPDEERESESKKLAPVRERAPYRRRIDEVTHYGHYDKSKLRSDEEVKQFINRWSVTRIHTK